MIVEEKIISEIKDIIKDDLVVVCHTRPPKYLSHFVAEDDVLFIYKQKEQLSTSDMLPSTKNKFDSDSEDSDFTGQPLECPFSSDDDEPTMTNLMKYKEENKQNPLDLSNAKIIISMINLKLSLALPLFVLTNGGDNDNTIIVGSFKCDGWQTRSWITLHDFAVEKIKVANVDEMVKKHHKLSLINPKFTTSEVSCQYLIESVGNSDATFLQESCGSVEFNLSWETPSFTVPLDRTAVKITINTSIGHENSEISIFWLHLTLLHDYLEIIKKWKVERNSSQGLYSRHSIDFPNINKLSLQFENSSSKSLQERLNELLQMPNEMTGMALTSRITENEKRTLEDTVRKFTNVKKAEEFTDRLWNLLIECTSYEELCSSFDKVFQAVKNASCKPFIKSTNTTRLATALRCCSQDPTRFTLTVEPLELLVEAGIEKLKKDYIGIFFLAKVTTSEQLRIPQVPKFPEIPIVDWVDICSQWITWLIRIHVSLQLMLFTESLVKLKGCVISLTSLTLKYYLSPQSPIETVVDPRSITSQSFTTSVNTVDISDLLNRKTPFNSWTLKLHSEISNRRVTSIFHRDINEIFPSSVCLVDEMENSGNNTYMMNTFPYHCYNFHSVSDLLE